jgi:hypothetical protein
MSAQKNPRESNSKYRSKESISHTGDKFNDLYLLAKVQQNKQKQDKTSEELEYEKNKEECTFAPNCKRLSTAPAPSL